MRAPTFSWNTLLLHDAWCGGGCTFISYIPYTIIPNVMPILSMYLHSEVQRNTQFDYQIPHKEVVNC